MTTLLDRYERIAPFYDLLDAPFERTRYRRLRPVLLHGLSGRLLDAGVGTGRNFQYYPPDAAVVGIDLSPAMLARAQRRRQLSRAKVELKQMDVTSLDFGNDTFDGAIAAFLFCVLPDERQQAALRELARVVKPGGPIRLLDYVRPRGAVRQLLSRAWAPWIAWAYGASFDRHTDEHIEAAGLELVDTRFLVGDLVKLVNLRVPKKPT